MSFRFKLSALLCAIAFVSSVSLVAAETDLRSRIREETSGFKDVTLIARVLRADQDELRKIGKDFGKSYDCGSTTIQFKSPDKMKMTGKIGMARISVVINGDWKATHFIITKKENIKDAPHKRQTDFDIGIFTDSLWRDYIVLDTEKAAGGKEYLVTFVRDNSRGRKIYCWIDADTLKMLKVEKREENGDLKARYIYSGHKRFGGIWVPGRVDVYNRDGKLAGATAYEDIRVNIGIPDAEFKI